MTSDFKNRGFDIAATSGVFGEADEWIWETSVERGVFARFNDGKSDSFMRPVELFAGYWMRACSWEYDDETERMAAASFTSDDIGRLAFQRSDETVWRLIGAEPTWAQVDAFWNHEAVDSFDDGDPVFAAFIVSSTSPTTRVENFSLWDPEKIAGSIYEAHALFSSWQDEAATVNIAPNTMERFSEGYENTIFATSKKHVPSLLGRLVGNEISFPAHLPPTQNLLWVYRDLQNDIVELALESKTYDAAEDLADEIDGKWRAANDDETIVEWTASGGRIQAEWKGFFGVELIALCVLKSKASSDVRNILGFNSMRSEAIVKPSQLAGVSVAIDDDDYFLLDSNTAIMLVVDYHADAGGKYLRPFDLTRATFDGGTKIVEAFKTEQWSQGENKDHYEDDDLTFAHFGDPRIPKDRPKIEEFNAADWPDLAE